MLFPGWYTYPTGEKCRNDGIRVSVIENMVLTEIEKYKDAFIADMPETEEDTLSGIQALITEHEANLQKQIRALEIVNDAYEYGDYSRDEWLKQKRKWEEEIFNTKNTLYDLQKQAKSTVQVTNADRQAMLTAFYEYHRNN